MKPVLWFTTGLCPNTFRLASSIAAIKAGVNLFILIDRLICYKNYYFYEDDSCIIQRGDVLLKIAKSMEMYDAFLNAIVYDSSNVYQGKYPKYHYFDG